MSRVIAALLAGAVMLPAAAVSAQEAGVKAGLNLASLTPEEDESPDITRRRGLVAGAWMRKPIRDRLSLQVEGLFAEKGVEFDISALAGAPGSSAELQLRYLEVPILARIDAGAAAANPRFFVVGGAAPAFKLSARSRVTVNGEEQTRDEDDEVEAFDVGLVAGAGVALGRAQIEGRYTHGLMRINTDDNEPNDRVQNRVFSVTVGFRLR